jgi:hypothetical protein
MADVVRIKESKFSSKPHIEKVYDDDRIRISPFLFKGRFCYRFTHISF